MHERETLGYFWRPHQINACATTRISNISCQLSARRLGDGQHVMTSWVSRRTVFPFANTRQADKRYKGVDVLLRKYLFKKELTKRRQLQRQRFHGLELGLSSSQFGSREPFDMFWSWSDRVRGSSEVALVKRPDSVLREGSDDRVQNASVVEEHEILLRPVVWIDQLCRT